MLDFVKISFLSKEYAEYLQANDFLALVRESKRKYTSAKSYLYNGLTFDIYNSGRVFISGSLHKYWNNGHHNYNDFSYTELLSTIEDLVSKFTPFILTGQINNLEAGVNIQPPFRASEYLKKVIALIGSERHPITKNDLKGFKKGYHFQKTHWGLKIYDKGKQYNRLEEIVRHEFKTYKMQVIKDAGITSVIDLCDMSKMELLSKCLLDSYKEVLISEVVNTDKLSRNDERIYNECINPDYWDTWNKDKRCKRKAQFNQIIYDHASTDIKTIVSDLMKSKVSVLLSETKKSINVFTNIQNHYLTLKNNQSTNDFTINIIGKNVDPQQNKRSCQSCGNDISHQDKKSKFCSAKYVGYQRAHQCRNNNSNPRNNFNRKIETINSRGVLFPIEPFIKTILR